ncbi:MAG: HEAT repeat domain-containing protein, partial [Candidatus Hodarchaeales archaeon]
MKNEIERMLHEGKTATLGKTYGANAIPELSKYLKHKDEKLRLAAIEALGHTGDAQAAIHLVEFVHREPDDRNYPLVSAAFENLGDVGLEQALLELIKPKQKAGNRQKLQKVLRDVDVNVLQQTINAIKIVSPGNALYVELAIRLFVKEIPNYTSYEKKLKYPEEKEKIKARLGQIFKNKDDIDHINTALDICEMFPRVGRFNYKHLVDLMDSSNEELAVRAVRVLGEIKARKVIPEIEHKLNPKYPLKVRLQVAKTLGELKAKEAVDTLISAMEKDPNGDVQLEAIVALGKIGKAAAAPLVDKLTRDENVDKVENALKRIGPSAVPYLSRAIESSNDKIRKNAIDLAQLILTTKYGQAGTIAKLIEFLGDKSKQVQESVIDAITKMGDPGIEYLIVGLREAEVRPNAILILEEFGSYNIKIVLDRFYKTNPARFIDLATLLAV